MVHLGPVVSLHLYCTATKFRIEKANSVPCAGFSVLIEAGDERDAGVYEKYLTVRARKPNEVQREKDKQGGGGGGLAQ